MTTKLAETVQIVVFVAETESETEFLSICSLDSALTLHLHSTTDYKSRAASNMEKSLSTWLADFLFLSLTVSLPWQSNPLPVYP